MTYEAPVSVMKVIYLHLNECVNEMFVGERNILYMLDYKATKCIRLIQEPQNWQKKLVL